MKKNLLKLLTALLFLALAANAQAADHGGGHGDMAGMEMGGAEIRLHDSMENGVKAQAVLRDIGKAMAEAGMSMSHHFMVSFTDTATGKPIDSGLVAVKVIDPNGNKQEAVKMMAMDGSFGADVALAKKGKYVFEVGTKLGNGEKRQFHFEHMVK
ncbi:hypothetical protein ACUUL3_16590 [Thiovibrio sp. JS02]